MIIIVMGVAGSGKTTIGRRLAERLGWPFYDGDDFHPPANIEKMSHGIPLNDDDRSNWLSALAALIREQLANGRSAVVACSALKQHYRDQLRINDQVRFVYLKGSYQVIWQRLQARSGHYMKAALLASQFATLEEPSDALTVSIEQPEEQVVEQIWQGILREE